MSTSSSVSPLLSTRCRIPGRNLWFARASLYDDAVRITGWRWSGAYDRVVKLSRVERVQWWAVLDDVNFMIHLDEGGVLPLQLYKGAGMWNCKIHELLGWDFFSKATLPGTTEGRDASSARPSSHPRSPSSRLQS